MNQVFFEKELMHKPIKVWTDNKGNVDEGTLEQAMNLANLPFTFKWVSLMPDFHKGYSMPIGGVLATERAIIPNAIGSDIGCGISYVQTNIPAFMLKNDKSVLSSVVAEIMGRIPVGRSNHKNLYSNGWMSDWSDALSPPDKGSPISNRILGAIEGKHRYAFGTLGDGNHFISIDEDNDGLVGIMLHSGSRSLGADIAKRYSKAALKLNERYFSLVPSSWGLSFFPIEDVLGVEYKEWMNFACVFSRASRSHMVGIVKDVLANQVGNNFGFVPKFARRLDVHHNYADIEAHFGKNVWVHRKGAVRAREGDVVIIPGAMGSYSYLAEGLGNRDSFTSAPHGAGRRMSRTEARNTFSSQEVVEDSIDFVIGKNDMGNVAEEYKGAYKDINEVMRMAGDLVRPTKWLKTLAVVKG